MITEEQAQEVFRLFEEGTKRDRIASLLGIGNKSVSRILNGDWSCTYGWKIKERCPTCGGMVAMPCQKCASKNITLEPLSCPDDVLDKIPLELDPHHQERYLEIFEKKVKSGARKVW